MVLFVIFKQNINLFLFDFVQMQKYPVKVFNKIQNKLFNIPRETKVTQTVPENCKLFLRNDMLNPYDSALQCIEKRFITGTTNYRKRL